VTETYDAKIFSIATLLSDYLVYNSLRLIDQSSIEYLEYNEFSKLFDETHIVNIV